MPKEGPRRRRAAAPSRGTSVRAPPKIGLALAGGGPLGGIYEVGALLALADSLEGLDLNDLHAYVGVSSGSFVAAALANGISPSQMYRLFIEDGAEAALKPELFLRPAMGEFARRAAALPALLIDASLKYMRDPFHRGAMESLATLLARIADRRVRQPRRRCVSSRACSRRPVAPTIFASLAASCFSSRRTSIPASR